MTWIRLLAAVGVLAAQTEAPKSPDASAVHVELAKQRFDAARLTLDGLADVDPEITLWDVGGVFSQWRRLDSPNEKIELLVRAHADESLDSFEREHYSFKLAKRVPAKVCGRPAELVRASRAAQHITCAKVERGHGGNHPVDRPPAEVWAVGFAHAGLRVVLSIEVEAARPTPYQPLLEKVIASVRCF